MYLMEGRKLLDAQVFNGKHDCYKHRYKLASFHTFIQT